MIFHPELHRDLLFEDIDGLLLLLHDVLLLNDLLLLQDDGLGLSELLLQHLGFY